MTMKMMEWVDYDEKYDVLVKKNSAADGAAATDATDENGFHRPCETCEYFPTPKAFDF